MSESLKDKTIKGTIWSAVDTFLGQGVTFLVGIILARLLSPDEYGLIGICLIFNTVLNGIVDCGFSNALIRKQNCTKEDYNTMFFTNMVISIVLYFLLFFISPYIASFFERRELLHLIRVTGLVLLFNALSLTQQTILARRVDFKTKTKASIISALISGIIGIGMAYLDFGVWSLVGQMISKQLVYTICLWLLNRWVPSFVFSTVAFQYMWGFGWKLLVSGLLNNIWNQLYQVFVGKFYAPATLGQYTRSRQFSVLLSENFTMIIQRVSFPVLSQIQDDKIRMKEAYRKIIKVTMYITVSTLFFLGAISEPFIYCVIGPKWHQASTFLPIICVSMSLYPMHAINLNMLQLLGRSDIYLKIEITKKIISIIPLLLCVYISIYWMLISSIFTGLCSFFLNTWYSGKCLGYTSFQQLKDVAPSYCIGVLVAGSVFFIKYLPIKNWEILIVQLILGLLVFILCSRVFRITEFIEIQHIIKNIIERIKEIIKTKYSNLK